MGHSFASFGLYGDDVKKTAPRQGESGASFSPCAPRTSCFLLSTIYGIHAPEQPCQFLHRLLHVASAWGGWAMTFEEILDQAIAMLQRRGRLTYGTLKRQFQLDDAALDDLKEQLLYAYPQVVDDAGRGVVWTGETAVSPTTTPPTSQPAPPGSPHAPQAVHPPPTATSP